MPELAVRQVTVDFEKALWSALREVLPTVKIQGCVFHWTQAVWRKVCIALYLLADDKTEIKSSNYVKIVKS